MSVKNKVKRCNKEIKRLQEELEMYKDFKEIANTKIGDANPLKVLEVNKILDRQCKRLKYILDKVTDKLKEDIEKTKEQIKHYERQYKTAKEKEDKFHIKSFHRQINRWQSRFETLREILNIIEGENRK